MEYVEAAITVISIISGIIGLFKARTHRRRSKRLQKYAVTMVNAIEDFTRRRKDIPPLTIKQTVWKESCANRINEEFNDFVQSVTNNRP